MLHIGVMCEAVQLSDILGIDMLGTLSTEYLAVASTIVPTALRTRGTEMTFHYIASSLDASIMTPSIRFIPTTTYATCRRDLDILLIGGPPLTHRPAAATQFLQEAVPQSGTVLTTCIGSMWLASAGVLDGRAATTNRGALEMARLMHPNVDWKDQRWVVDGKFWTAGGAGVGLDMVAEFMRGRFDGELVEFGLELLEFTPAGRGGGGGGKEYTTELLYQWGA